MKVVYLDTSLFVRLYFDKPAMNSKIMRILNAADELVSSSLLEAEFLSVIKRENENLSTGIKFLKQISLITPDRSLSRELELVLEHGYLRGADAFHLAVSLYLDPERRDIKFASNDKKQLALAQDLGFAVLSA